MSILLSSTATFGGVEYHFHAYSVSGFLLVLFVVYSFWEVGDFEWSAGDCLRRTLGLM